MVLLRAYIIIFNNFNLFHCGNEEDKTQAFDDILIIAYLENNLCSLGQWLYWRHHGLSILYKLLSSL